MLVEKYRPQTFDEILGQDKIKGGLKNLINRTKHGEKLPHMLFSGPPGCGKTAMAAVLAKALEIDFVEYNASDNRRIEFVREELKSLAIVTGRRIVLLDEADAVTHDAQHALRRIIEKATCTFILTCNEDWKIIDPIKSRCINFRFERLSRKNLLELITKVLKSEGVIIEKTEDAKKAFELLLEYCNGDARKILNMIEGLINENKEFTPGNIQLLMPTNFAQEILDLALQGNFTEALKKLEDTYIYNQLDANLTIKNLYSALKDLPAENIIKFKLFDKLSDIERNIKIGCHPLIQFASFLSVVYMSPQMIKAEVSENVN